MSRRDSILVSRTLYQIGVLSLIAAVLWVGVGIYSITGEEFKTEIDKGVLEPFNPTLDEEVVKAMTGRVKIEQDVPVQPTVNEVDLTTTPEATPGALQSDTISVDEVR